VYKSDSALVLKYANRNQSERFKARDQAALNLSIMGTLGMYKEATDILVKPQWSPELKVLTML
jgi:hypothetical protein